MNDYFSDRQQGPRPRTEETVSHVVWGGIVGLVQSLITTGAFGVKYPENCPDGHGPIGTDEHALSLAVQAEMPGLVWPLSTTETVQAGFFSEQQPYAPDTLLVLDFIEFCYRVVAKPIQGSHHSYFGHYHLHFNEAEGKQTFLEDINRIFSRNNLAFELCNSGQIVRLAPAVLRESLASEQFSSGDKTLDGMLEDTRTKFLNPAPAVRREAIERLWDCWERLKSLENPGNKRQSVETLLSKAAPDAEFRSVLDAEARTLTDIGNSFHIRHSEVTQSAVTDSAHVDYLFHRLYSMIQLLLLKRRDPR
ncbi:hypothetical protein J3D48_005706 [Pseudomonas fluorescens]|uniref:AbiJ-NTD4 domain-containing protein n=1 Tax=Pseudomonas fluorescens TaxID=294 RepID=UPI00209FEA48|nr:hypothetical protein [Pseudomonas fluorescens]MCP1489393.1 hypothetical protein [Pseudomonas fluorescens]